MHLTLMANLHTCSSGLIVKRGSCKQSHPGSQNYVGLLVPTHIIFCGTNREGRITIYNLNLGITHRERQ